MILRLGCGILLTVLLLSGSPQARAVEVQDYDFPITDPFEATVVGTPSKFRADLPKHVPVQELWLDIFPDRETPELFWYNEKLNISVARQRQKAPLIFNIAGTGAGHNSALMQMMERAFNKAGFHVISLPSPTHPNFITAASETQVPGPLMSDARDLYRVMKAAYAAVADSIEVSEFYVTGYSLGAAESAFVSYIDETEGAFNFKKVLMINPPVSLYNSVDILDHMLNAIPGGTEHFASFFEKLMESFAEVYRRSDVLDFSDDFLYQVYNIKKPGDQPLKALIGISFRLSSASILFSADYLSHSGIVVGPKTELSSTQDLTNYFKVSTRLSFVDYIEELVVPFLQRSDPSMTLQRAIDENSLHFLDDYLRNSDKIGLMGNADDVILADGEFDYLADVFPGNRSRLYPTGGHCGNMPYTRNVEDMVAFFKGEWGQ